MFAFAIPSIDRAKRLAYIVFMTKTAVVLLAAMIVAVVTYAAWIASSSRTTTTITIDEATEFMQIMEKADAMIRTQALQTMSEDEYREMINRVNRETVDRFRRLEQR